MLRKNHSNIDLQIVSEKDFKFLFELLKERESSTNISHRKMTSYKEHVNFVSSKPYSKWYVIYYGKNKVGSIYLSKQNEIGIFIKKSFFLKELAFHHFLIFHKLFLQPKDLEECQQLIAY